MAEEETEDSILNSIKELLNLPIEDPTFDKQLIELINAEFSTIQQLGVGPLDEFLVEDKTTKWSAFIEQTKYIQMVRTAVWIGVKIIFDPPPTGPATAAFERRLNEVQWRLRIEADRTKLSLLPVLVVVVDPETI